MHICRDCHIKSFSEKISIDFNNHTEKQVHFGCVRGQINFVFSLNWMQLRFFPGNSNLRRRIKEKIIEA